MERNLFTVIVTYNGMAWIGKCIASLLQSSYPTRILVIDNGSTDGTPGYIRENFSQVDLTLSGHNLGFGQANNIGISRALAAGASHIFLLNQDAWVDPGVLGELVSLQSACPDYGIISPLHLNGAGSALDINFALYLRQSDLGPFLNAWLLGLPEIPEIIDTFFVNAAAWMMSADCIRRTGGFDPLFFHYGEDENYAKRVVYKGFRIGVFPGARIYHDREQRLSATVSPAMQLRTDINHFLIHACDPRRPSPTAFILKRTVRHALLTMLYLFQKEKRNYHFQLARVAVTRKGAIRKSRLSAAGVMPFLEDIHSVDSESNHVERELKVYSWNSFNK
jgi:GT2 family glycosyltransferase